MSILLHKGAHVQTAVAAAAAAAAAEEDAAHGSDSNEHGIHFMCVCDVCCGAPALYGCKLLCVINLLLMRGFLQYAELHQNLACDGSAELHPSAELHQQPLLARSE